MMALLHRRSGLRARAARLLAVVLPLSLALCLSLTASRPHAAFYLMPARAWELALEPSWRQHLDRSRSNDEPRPGAELGRAHRNRCRDHHVRSNDWFSRLRGTSSSSRLSGSDRGQLDGNEWISEDSSLNQADGGARLVLLLLVSVALAAHRDCRANALGEQNIGRDLLLGGGISLVLAAISYRWIESPIRRSAVARALSDRQTVAWGAAATAIGVLLAGGVGAWAKYWPRSPVEAQMLAAQRDTPPFVYSAITFSATRLVLRR